MAPKIVHQVRRPGSPLTPKSFPPAPKGCPMHIQVPKLPTPCSHHLSTAVPLAPTEASSQGLTSCFHELHPSAQAHQPPRGPVGFQQLQCRLRSETNSMAAVRSKPGRQVPKSSSLRGPPSATDSCMPPPHSFQARGLPDSSQGLPARRTSAPKNYQTQSFPSALTSYQPLCESRQLLTVPASSQ